MSRPNILLLVLDAVRADHVSCYGHDRETTPNIDDLASSGLQYGYAFANSNWTGASHPALFSGLLPSQSGVYGDNMTLPNDVDLLAELLSEGGYRTFATSAGAHIRSERGYDRGFDEFHETYRVRPSKDFLDTFLHDRDAFKQLVYSGIYGHDNYTLYKFNRLQRWVQDGGDTPFFAFVNCKTAHNPYNPPRQYKQEFCDRIERPRFEFTERALDKLGYSPQNVRGMDTERLQKLSWQYPILGGDFEPTDEELDVLTSWYDGAIRYLDERIGHFIDFMNSEGLLEDTHIIITADHGELFGEHGMEKHHDSLYEPVLHIPLIIHPAEHSTLGSGRVDKTVSLVDLYPTILDLADVPAPERSNADSLTPTGRPPTDRSIYAEVGRKSPNPVQRHYPSFEKSDCDGPLQSVRDNEYKLIRSPDGAIELYQWRDDPAEQTDLAQDEPEVVDRLTTAIDKKLGSMRYKTLNENVDNKKLKEHLQDMGYM